MRDKRRVDELSIEELERVLAMRRREQRQKRLGRMKRNGRVIGAEPTPSTAKPKPDPKPSPSAESPQTLDDIIANIAQNPSGKPPPTPPADAPQLLVDEQPAAEAVPVADSRRLRRRPNPEKAAKRTMGRLLLLVEVAAVLGLFYLAFELTRGIGILENRTAEAQQEIEDARARTVPTLEPTPMMALNQVVLPGGHKFEEGRTPQLNIEEIPQNVRFAVADQITRPVINRPPRTDETALRLTVPKLNIDQTIVQGADWEALKQGVGQVLNGYDPADETGNVALVAHNDIYGELFRDLDQLQPGDQFQVQTEEQVYLYQVTHQEIVAPTDVHVLNSVGKAKAVLISCYPYRVNTQRIIVHADRIG